MDLLFPEGSTIVAKKIERDDLVDGDIAVYCFDNEYAVRRYRRIESARSDCLKSGINR